MFDTLFCKFFFHFDVSKIKIVFNILEKTNLEKKNQNKKKLKIENERKIQKKEKTIFESFIL